MSTSGSQLPPLFIQLENLDPNTAPEQKAQLFQECCTYVLKEEPKKFSDHMYLALRLNSNWLLEGSKKLIEQVRERFKESPAYPGLKEFIDYTNLTMDELKSIFYLDPQHTFFDEFKDFQLDKAQIDLVVSVAKVSQLVGHELTHFIAREKGSIDFKEFIKKATPTKVILEEDNLFLRIRHVLEAMHPNTVLEVPEVLSIVATPSQIAQLTNYSEKIYECYDYLESMIPWIKMTKDYPTLVALPFSKLTLHHIPRFFQLSAIHPLARLDALLNTDSNTLLKTRSDFEKALAVLETNPEIFDLAIQLNYRHNVSLFRLNFEDLSLPFLTFLKAHPSFLNCHKEAFGISEVLFNDPASQYLNKALESYNRYRDQAQNVCETCYHLPEIAAYCLTRLSQGLDSALFPILTNRTLLEILDGYLSPKPSPQHVQEARTQIVESLLSKGEKGLAIIYLLPTSPELVEKIAGMELSDPRVQFVLDHRKTTSLALQKYILTLPIENVPKSLHTQEKQISFLVAKLPSLKTFILKGSLQQLDLFWNMLSYPEHLEEFISFFTKIPFPKTAQRFITWRLQNPHAALPQSEDVLLSNILPKPLKYPNEAITRERGHENPDRALALPFYPLQLEPRPFPKIQLSTLPEKLNKKLPIQEWIKEVALYLSSDEGELNVLGAAQLLTLQPAYLKEKSDCQSHLQMTLTAFVEDPRFAEKLQDIPIPQKGTLGDFFLQRAKEHNISPKKCLANELITALLTRIRQGDIGNCYLCSILIQSHSTPTDLLFALDDYITSLSKPRLISSDLLFDHPLITARALNLTSTTNKGQQVLMQRHKSLLKQRGFFHSMLYDPHGHLLAVEKLQEDFTSQVQEVIQQDKDGQFYWKLYDNTTGQVLESLDQFANLYSRCNALLDKEEVLKGLSAAHQKSNLLKEHERGGHPEDILKYKTGKNTASSTCELVSSASIGLRFLHQETNNLPKEIKQQVRAFPSKRLCLQIAFDRDSAHAFNFYPAFLLEKDVDSILHELEDQFTHYKTQLLNAEQQQTIIASLTPSEKNLESDSETIKLIQELMPIEREKKISLQDFSVQMTILMDKIKGEKDSKEGIRLIESALFKTVGPSPYFIAGDLNWYNKKSPEHDVLFCFAYSPYLNEIATYAATAETASQTLIMTYLPVDKLTVF